MAIDAGSHRRRARVGPRCHGLASTHSAAQEAHRAIAATNTDATLIAERSARHPCCPLLGAGLTSHAAYPVLGRMVMPGSSGIGIGPPVGVPL